MTDQLGAQLTPAEESYFESGGTSEIPTEAPAAQETTSAEPVAAKEPAKEETTADKTVPLAALHEERTRRRELDRKARDLETQLAELKGKFSIVERLNPTKEEKVPTVEEDIFGVVKNTTTDVAKIKEVLAKQDEEAKARKAEDELITAYRADAAQFRSKQADFDAAYNHLMQSRVAELQAMGYTSPQMLQQALLADERAIAEMALKDGQSPSERIYELAKLRGYAVKAEKAAEKPAAEKIAELEKAQAANKSLAGTGGGTGETEMTAEQLIKMPMAEFEAWCEKNPAKARRMLGG